MTDAIDVAGVLLAAGGASRFGRQKLAEPFEGVPLMWHALDALARAPVTSRHVVVGSDAESVREVIDRWCEREGRASDFLQVHHNALWQDGLCTSLHVAVRIDAPWWLVLLGDQPYVGEDHLHALVTALGGDLKMKVDAVASCYEGRPGVPALLSASLRTRILSLQGDTGARDILRELLSAGRLNLVPFAEEKLRIDIDTPEELTRAETITRRGRAPLRARSSDRRTCRRTPLQSPSGA